MCDEAITPDQLLANEIIKKLTDDGLVPRERAGVITAKLLTGKASEVDWRLWVYPSQSDRTDETDKETDAHGEEAN